MELLPHGQLRQHQRRRLALLLLLLLLLHCQQHLHLQLRHLPVTLRCCSSSRRRTSSIGPPRHELLHTKKRSHIIVALAGVLQGISLELQRGCPCTQDMQ